MKTDANKAELAYDMLERMITFQHLKPGAMVSEGTLMEMTGLGRHPVRSALQRLSWERMVDVHPRRGIIIPPISVEAQIKLLAVRRTVEELAVRWAAAKADDRERTAMSELGAELLAFQNSEDIVAFGTLLKKVHHMIAQASHNEYLQLSMAPLQGLSRRFWFANLESPDRDLARASRFHANILNAIVGEDEAAAAGASLALNDYLRDFVNGVLTRSRA